MSMSSTAANTRATIVPALRYRDAKAAIAFLCDGLGFQRHAVYEDKDGSVMHAELSFGNGMIMLGPVAPTEFGQNMCQPDEIAMKETQSPYLVVADADAVYRSANAAGFALVRDIRDEDYGGRGFTCRDPEGHLWSIGTYDPWKVASRD
jgi:uncharacterized glyoxalase superfamily protein PhnB